MNKNKSILCILSAIWLLAVVDLGCTIWADCATPFQELNPLAQKLLHHNYLYVLVIFKMGLTLFGTWIFWHFRYRWSARIAAWTILLVFIGLTARWIYFWCAV